MALDIGIQSQEKNSGPLERELIVSLEFPEYSYLLDKFEELKNITGVSISDCDDARDQGDQLLLLQKLIEDAVSDVKKKPNEWQEHVGFQVKPRKENYETLIKKELLKKLNTFISLIEKARNEERVLYFFGD